ncbi:MAG: hypothetical protein HGA71_08705 [Azonexaceae bacterium]|nr:hypothetical protein [Azonexaceae bacterium]
MPKLRLYNYGSCEARRGRKKGHFTVTGDDPQKLVELAAESRSSIR